jgi:hypothetical protein
MMMQRRLFWMLTTIARDQSAEPLAGYWADLASADPARAHLALWTFVTTDGSVMPFLRERLRPAGPVRRQKLLRWISDLDRNEFKVRERATEELATLGERAVPFLRQALSTPPTLEAGRHVEALLEKAPRSGWQGVRAVAVLEHKGTPQARALLEELAAGALEARITQEAKSALERLGRRYSPGKQ